MAEEQDVESSAEVLHRAFHESWIGPSQPLNLYADSDIWRTQALAVIRIQKEV